MSQLSHQDERVKEFLAESHENLCACDIDLLALETDPTDRNRIASVFRALHTLKGTCGFFDFKKLEVLAHAGESVLSKARTGDLAVTAEVAATLLELVDAIRRTLAHIEKDGSEGDEEEPYLLERLRCFHEKKPVEPAPARAPGPPSTRSLAETLLLGSNERTVRVDVSLLDRLMNLVGELVLTRNQLLENVAEVDDRTLTMSSQRLNLVTSELQEWVMRTRLQRIGSIISKFPRIVRDLATGAGKRVRFEVDGAETELDRSILETIKDPLLHLLRNAVDHGLEPPDVRVKAGKPPEGRILLRAYHDSGQVNIEFEDDGSGINVDAVLVKAVAIGIVPRDRAATMSQQEIINLIFLPGFSTAERVTSISGRGVGADVVRNNVERIGGSVELVNRPGHGVTFKIRIPLTLAIVPALIVTCRDKRYAIPQANLVELLRVTKEEASSRIEILHSWPVYRLRNRLLPILHLEKLLGLERPAKEPSQPENDGDLSIVVLQVGERQFGLTVDLVSDTQEIVVKPLNRGLECIPVYSGATILGDGGLALILDVDGIAERAGLKSAASQLAVRDSLDAGRLQRATSQVMLLLVEVVGQAPMALSLSRAIRLIELERGSIVRAGPELFAHIGTRVLPLLELGALLGSPSRLDFLQTKVPEDGGGLHIVVCTTPGDRCFGLVVDRIVDVIEIPLELEGCGRRLGVRGTITIDGLITQILDVDEVLELAEAKLRGDRSAVEVSNVGR